jgi:hypothetical protein
VAFEGFILGRRIFSDSMTDDLTPNELRDLERRLEAAAETMPVEQLAYIKGLLDEWGRLTRGERDKPREGHAPREIPVAVNHESASRARIPKVE